MNRDRLKILFLQKRLLFPADSGGKIRTLNVLRHLARWHDITYLCNVQEHETPYIEPMRELGLHVEVVPWKETPRNSTRFYLELAGNLFSRYPYNVKKDYDPRLRARAERLLAEQPFDLVICDFVQMALNTIGLPAPASLLFEHNVEAMIFQRHAKAAASWARRKYMHIQWQKMQRFEGAAGKQFDAVIAVSEQDRDVYATEYGWQHVHVLDTAVDVDYFHPRQNEELSDRVVFVGSMDWLPNEDGVKWFVKHVWPQVLAARPDATFDIVGRNPPRGVCELANVQGVRVAGTVADVRPYMASAAVVVVPLWVGGGTRLKIYEAMAMGKAVVSTPLGAEGLPLDNGKHLLLADDANRFAQRVLELMNDSVKRHELGETSRQLVVQRYSSECVARQFERVCQHITTPPLEQKTLVASPQPG